MLGSSNTISNCNVVLNTAVAEALRQFADVLENAVDFESALHDLIKSTISKHKRIIFNGNGYDDAWIFEAEKRGLLNMKTTPDALPSLIAEKNIELFTTHKVYSVEELKARYEILSENYCKVINIEALTMLDMAKKDILPVVSEYSQVLGNTILTKKSVNKKIDCTYENELLERISDLTASAYNYVKALEIALQKPKTIDDVTKRSLYYKDEVLALMQKLRADVDALEDLVSAEYWPMPTYGDLLFGV